jgi:OmpA-OmpF porin, OOP family
MPTLEKIKSNNHSVSVMRSSVVRNSILLLIATTVFNIAYSQSGKNLSLADEYYAAGEYLTAAGLYQQFLHPAVKRNPASDFPLNSKKSEGIAAGRYHDKMDIVYKQAESYRMANYLPQALALYQQCFEKDSLKYAAALYQEAVCQRSMGDYMAAEQTLNRYLATDGQYKTEAEKEKANLQFIKKQLSRPDSVLYHVEKLDVPAGGGAYSFTTGPDNHFFITGTQTDSVKEEGVNPNHNRIFTASLLNGRIEKFEQIKIEGLNSTFNQGTASISADGNYIYFTQWSKENGKSVASIYYAVKKGKEWVRPAVLSTVNQQGHNSQQPFCSADGKYLFFASDRRGTVGNMDIWFAPIQANGKTGAPVNAGVAVNTKGNEQAPFYQVSSSTLIFSSDKSGMGGFDLFQASGTETTWQPAENMGWPVNSSRDDIYFYTPENQNPLQNAYVSSDRGSECCLGIYHISKTEKKKILTGMIRDCENNQPVAGAEIILQDTAGNVLHGTTNEEGKYAFNMPLRTGQGQVSVVKDGYDQQVTPVKIESSVQGWLEETWNNASICLQKHVEQVRAENVVSIYFDFDKSKLTTGGKLQLDSIYNVLLVDSTISLQISGYTDGRGSEVYNKSLSDKRAKACADYLIQKGINSLRITFESFGACCPVEMEKVNGRDNGDARAMNRRALINVKRS